MKVLAGSIALMCSVFEIARATTCSSSPPCGILQADRALFAGTVIEVRSPHVGTTDRTVVFKVDERFAGIASDRNVIAIQTEGEWMEKGEKYLVDASVHSDGTLRPFICGATGDLDQSADFLRFLRARRELFSETSLQVRVSANVALAEATVELSGPTGLQKGKTDGDGQIVFKGIRPGIYTVQASKPHHVPDPESSPVKVTILAGACPSMFVHLKPQTLIAGQVLDSGTRPAGVMSLRLISFSPHEVREGARTREVFRARSDAEGLFRFEGIAPGSYLLATDESSPMGISYYPGSKQPNMAVPVAIKLGQSVENLLFRLPDFGRRRTIRFRVLDEDGRPLAGARVRDEPLRGEESATKVGGVGELETNEAGEAEFRGFEGLDYRVRALYPDGAEPLANQFSDTSHIGSGNEVSVTELIVRRSPGTRGRKNPSASSGSKVREQMGKP